jgi:hypothetical protein
MAETKKLWALGDVTYTNDANTTATIHVSVYKVDEDTTSLIQQGSTIDLDFPYVTAPRALSLSANGKLLAIGSTLGVHVYQWQREDWVSRDLLEHDRPGNGSLGATDQHLFWSLDLSADGAVVVVGAGRVDLQHRETAVRIFQWNGRRYEQMSAVPGGRESPVAVSSDGSTVATGLPYAATSGSRGGSTRVYENSAPKCESGMSVLGISVTLDYAPENVQWKVTDARKGNATLAKSGRYNNDDVVLTVYEELCVDVEVECPIFTIEKKGNAMYLCGDHQHFCNNPSYPEVNDGLTGGLEHPGGYVLFLDGKEIARGGDFNTSESMPIIPCMDLTGSDGCNNDQPDDWCKSIGGNNATALADRSCYDSFAKDCGCDEGYVKQGSTCVEGQRLTPTPTAATSTSPSDGCNNDQPDDWCKSIGGNNATALADRSCYDSFAKDCGCDEGYVKQGSTCVEGQRLTPAPTAAPSTSPAPSAAPSDSPRCRNISEISGVFLLRTGSNGRFLGDVTGR